MSFVNSVNPLTDIHLDILLLKDGLVCDFRALIILLNEYRTWDFFSVI